jgi:4-hydroxy-4-methyl-2-oxoglutarate aldolase
MCAQRDCLAYHWLLDTIEPGDVVVLTRPERDEIAFWGEVMAVQAKAIGVAALLVDGAVRDVDEMAALGFPVWARSISPAGPTNEVPGEIDIPVTVGGVKITPGDLLVLDGDGVVAVPQSRCDDVLAAAEQRHSWEQSLLPRLSAGELTLDVLGIRSTADA